MNHTPYFKMFVWGHIQQQCGARLSSRRAVSHLQDSFGLVQVAVPVQCSLHGLIGLPYFIGLAAFGSLILCLCSESYRRLLAPTCSQGAVSEPAISVK